MFIPSTVAGFPSKLRPQTREEGERGTATRNKAIAFYIELGIGDGNKLCSVKLLLYAKDSKEKKEGK